MFVQTVTDKTITPLFHATFHRLAILVRTAYDDCDSLVVGFMLKVGYAHRGCQVFEIS